MMVETMFHGYVCDDKDARVWTQKWKNYPTIGRIKVVGMNDMSKDRGFLPPWCTIGRP